MSDQGVAPGMDPGADEREGCWYCGTPVPTYVCGECLMHRPHELQQIENYDHTTEHLGLVDIAGILVGGCFVPWAEVSA